CASLILLSFPTRRSSDLAFDGFFLGIRPDYVIEIRQDLLEEVDGPMLRHGLQELHGHQLMSIPKRRLDRPKAELLEHKYEQFRIDRKSTRLNSSHVSISY